MKNIIIIKKDDIVITEKEFEIIKMTAKGFTNNKIAFEMNCSHRTVQSRLDTIFKKLDAHSKLEMISTMLVNNKIGVEDIKENI